MKYFGYVNSLYSDDYAWYVTEADNKQDALSAIESTATQMDFDGDVDVDIMTEESAVEMLDRDFVNDALSLDCHNSVKKFNNGS